jgi:phage-related protein
MYHINASVGVTTQSGKVQTEDVLEYCSQLRVVIADAQTHTSNAVTPVMSKILRVWLMISK